MASGSESQPSIHRAMTGGNDPLVASSAPAAALDIELAGVAGAIAISAAASATVRKALARRATSIRPLVRGRTVWDAGPPAEAAIVESPNRLGRIEGDPGIERTVLVTEPGCPVPVWAETLPIVGLGSEMTRRKGIPRSTNWDSESFTRRTVAARVLAKRLNQLRGLIPAFGSPESPTFVVITGLSPAGIAARANAVSDAVTIEAVSVPGVPGALRISFVGDASPSAPAEISDAFAAALSGPLGKHP